MTALLATPQGRPTALTVNVSHAIVGVAGYGIARSLGTPTTGVLSALVLVCLHAYLDAPLAGVLASAAA